MRFVDEYRNKQLITRQAEAIKRLVGRDSFSFMEVCGTHTQSFFRFGLDTLLPPRLKLISGPGCPVCVSPQGFIDRAIAYCARRDTRLVTFGDMMKVPGTVSNLEKQRAAGADVSVAYCPLEAISIAKNTPSKKVIFLAVGFETTAPTIALTILKARKEKVRNIYFLVSIKQIVPAMEHLLKDRRIKIDGFLCPGHVSAIIGTRPYEVIPRRFKKGCCVAGFEPFDILGGLRDLIKQKMYDAPQVHNQYRRVVTATGNRRAAELMARVFNVVNGQWRGLGMIPKSGLALKKEFSDFDAEKNFPMSGKPQAISDKLARCKCADVLKGIIAPVQCPMFKKGCTPDTPFGPCMVSLEGACNAYYRYR